MHLNWPQNYIEGRDRFLAQARACGAALSVLKLHPETHDAPTLTTDVARLGESAVEHLVIVTSGVHGVEGALGSALQSEALKRLETSGLPNGVGVVMVHAVNPWGMQHLRRVDDSNVDINRNMLLGGERPPTHPGYAELDHLINPTGAPRAADNSRFWLAAALQLLRHRGGKDLAAAIANGQRTHPEGLFFGGHAPTACSRQLQRLLTELLDEAPRVTHLDVHSGLGPTAQLSLIGSSNQYDPADAKARVEHEFQHRYIPDDASSNPYEAQGSLSRWYHRTAVNTPYQYLCLEFGTVNAVRILSALRRENHAHHHSERNSRHYLAAKSALLEAFSPSSRRWRQQCLTTGLDVIERSCHTSA